MAHLEQWEIDLRKQLEGRINSNKPKNGQTWEDKLVEEIEDLPQVRERAQQKVKDKQNNTLIMMVLLIVLGITTLFAYDSKSGGKVQAWIQARFASSVAPEQPTGPVIGPGPHKQKDYDADIAALRNDIQRLEAENKANFDKLTKKVDWNSQRIVLMGMVLNENFMIVYNNYNRSHLIFFNRDWTIDQMPHHLELTDEDREYLKKYVKPAQ